MSINSIKNILDKNGFVRHGFTKIERPFSIDIYKSWLEEGMAGSMDYLSRHFVQKENPKLLSATAQSAIVVAVDYVQHPYPVENYGSLQIARYARGEDYHYWLKAKLDDVIKELKILYPENEFVSFTDSSPVLERDLAHRAGLGWIGKNTCLIDQKKGSLFLIGEIYTSLKLEPALQVPVDRCGTCSRCIDACPTQAIVEPRKLDARKCISFLTIESKELPTLELREKIGEWYFGCDICQTVCPWNQKAFGPQLLDGPKTNLIDDLHWILEASGKQIEKRFAGTPLTRANSFSHRRNAIVVAANLKIHKLRPYIEKHRHDKRLTELVEWALKKLDQPVT